MLSQKPCSACKQIKSLSAFRNRKDSKDGHRGQCKLCDNTKRAENYYRNLEKQRKRSRLKGIIYRGNNRLTINFIAVIRRLKKFGLTPEKYESMYLKQFGNCAITGRPNKQKKRMLSVDHDHKNGKIRGLLDDKVNMALGTFEDNIWWLIKAIAYLIKWRIVHRLK
jgi:hypothetical protein